jgi:hypothetical protein
MRKKFIAPIILVLVFAIALSACSAQAQVGKIAQSALYSSDSATATPAPDDSLSAMQLAIGTIKLDGTTNAVSASQAATLLPLWKALKEDAAKAVPAGGPGGPGGKPDASGTPAATPDATLVAATPDTSAMDKTQTDFDAITAAMTDAQITAIEALNLNRETMTSTLKELGITLKEQNGNGPMGTPDPNMTLTPRPTLDSSVTLTPPPTQAAGEKPAGGPGGAGGPGAGGPGGQGGQGGNAPQGNGQQMNGQPGGNRMGGFVSTEVIDAVISYLEKLTA